MKISLVTALNYALTPKGIRPDPYIPLGLLAVASLAESCGHTVRIVDVNRLPAEAGIAHGKSFVDGAAAYIRSTEADVVGFMGLSHSYPQTIRMARALGPGPLVLFGGPQASTVDVETMKEFPFVHVILRGEVEPSLGGLLAWAEGNGSLEGVTGATFRRDGQIVRNPDTPPVEDMDTLPRPAFHLYPIKEFPVQSIEAGRGCPFDCTFCMTNRYFQRCYRVKSAPRLVEDMRAVVGLTGCRSFLLIHDMLTANRRRVVEFCEELIRTGLDVRWRASARVNGVDRELLDLMHRAGCHEIFFGVETGSAKTMLAIHKKIDVEDVVPTLGYAQSRGIAPTASFIVGFPDETREDMRETTRLAFELFKAGIKDVEFHILSPEPGSQLTKEYEGRLVLDKVVSHSQFDILQDEDWELIEKSPMIFSGSYSFPLQHLTRRFVKWTILQMFIASRVVPRLAGAFQAVSRLGRPLTFWKKSYQ